MSYTSIYSLTDDGGASPQLPQSVSEQGDGATNVPIQSICPVRVVSHVQALADAVAYAVVLDLYTYSAGIAHPTVNREPPLHCYARPGGCTEAPSVGCGD